MRKQIFVQGGVNGLFSTYMLYSVRNFQRQNGLPVTGVIDEATARALGLFSGSWADLTTGASGAKTLAVQRALVRLDLNLPGGVTGTYSTGTWYAIRMFQRIRGLPQTGVVDATTARLLGVLVAPDQESIWTNLGIGTSGQQIVTAQRALMNSGIYLRGGANGIFSEHMWYSVRNFQRRSGLRVTGTIDALTARALGLFDTSANGWLQLGLGSVGAAVTAAERALIGEGFGVGGAADRLFGADTYRGRAGVPTRPRSPGHRAHRSQHGACPRSVRRGTHRAGAGDGRGGGTLDRNGTGDVNIYHHASTRRRPPTSLPTLPSATTSSTTVAPSTSLDDAPPEVLGDLVWLDTDGDGLQDGDEPGIPGVTVVLLDSAGAVELARDETDQSGVYEFAGLSQGTYVLEVALDGYGVTVAHQGTDDELDSQVLTVDAVRGTARTDPVAFPTEHPDGFDFGLTTVEDGSQSTTTSSAATTTTVVTPTEPPPTTSTTVAATTTLAPATTTVPPTTAQPTTTPPTTAPPTTPSTTVPMSSTTATTVGG